MTTQQGQQMIVTQVPRQHHVIVNQHSGNGLYFNSYTVDERGMIQLDLFEIFRLLFPFTTTTKPAGGNVIQSNQQNYATNAIITNTPISSSSQPQLMPQMRSTTIFFFPKLLLDMTL